MSAQYTVKPMDASPKKASLKQQPDSRDEIACHTSGQRDRVSVEMRQSVGQSAGQSADQFLSVHAFDKSKEDQSKQILKTTLSTEICQSHTVRQSHDIHDSNRQNEKTGDMGAHAGADVDDDMDQEYDRRDELFGLTFEISQRPELGNSLQDSMREAPILFDYGPELPPYAYMQQQELSEGGCPGCYIQGVRKFSISQASFERGCFPPPYCWD